MKSGGVVLCGGLSTRMGRPKAWLPFGPELMLQRVVRILSEVVSPIVVVAARDQEIPELPADVEIDRDEYDECGPLAGLAVGLTALAGRCDAAYVTSCDVPLLTPLFVERVAALLGDFDVAIPRDADHSHPLAAVYRTSLAHLAHEQISKEERRLLSLLDHCRSRVIEVAELHDVDPELQSLRNINSPDDYARALREAGFASS
ncbi:MAG: molybdenum cofactor guanylyltransferase [Planctomycetia bacterium]|nr:molybdenum cofactor guanylyltransferase [Planctomycetia bacterium]